MSWEHRNIFRDQVRTPCKENYIIRFMLSLAIVLLLAIGCHSVRAQNNRSSDKSDIQVSKPTTLKQILENIRYAVDRNLLIQPETYVEDRLTLLFGGTSVLWISKDKTSHIKGDVEGLDTIVAPVLVDRIQVNALSVDFLWRSVSPQTRVADLHLNSSASVDVRFDDVVRIFGANWKNAPPEANLHRQYDVVTRQHGNARIIYDLRIDRATYRIRFEFHGNSSLYILHLTAEEEI